MIYKTFFDVPAGAMCRPHSPGDGYGFFKKSSWEKSDGGRFGTALGQWETRDREATITESQVDEFFLKYRGLYLKDDFKTHFFGGKE